MKRVSRYENRIFCPALIALSVILLAGTAAAAPAPIAVTACGVVISAPVDLASSNNIHGNTVTNSNHLTVAPGGDGIVSVSSSKNTIQGNFFAANVRIGIHLGAGNSGNIIKQNTAFDNVTADVEDDSSSCVNTWSSNFFGTPAIEHSTLIGCIQ